MRASWFLLLLASFACAQCPRKTFERTTIEMCTNSKCAEQLVNNCASPDTLLLTDITKIKLKSSVKRLLRDAFANLTVLKIVDVSQSDVEVLSPKSFNNLPSVEEFFGMNNNIRSVPFGVFSNMNFKKVELYRNKIRSIESLAFSNMEKLETLNLEENEIAEIDPDWFEGTTKMTYLNLGKNKIEIIEANTFKNLATLKNLDISFNQITKVEDQGFSGLKFLETLNLEWNILEIFRKTTLDYQTQIGTLYLGMNNLTILYEGFFDWMKIEKLSLDPNPWSCPCLARIGKDAYQSNVIIIKREDYSALWWNDTFPVCVSPVKDPLVCYSNFASENKEGLLYYYEVMKNQIQVNYDIIFRKIRY